VGRQTEVMGPLEKHEMPAIVLKAETGTTKSRREGNTTIVEKTVEKGVLTETHTGAGHRLKGKQAGKQTVTLSTAELKALKAGKAASVTQVANINIQANKFMGQMEASHKAELKVITDKLQIKEAQLRMIFAQDALEVRETRQKKEQKEKKGRGGRT
jgi:microcystin-dependent protein